MSQHELQYLRDQSLSARLKRAIGGVPSLSLRLSTETRSSRILASLRADGSPARVPFSRWEALKACARIAGDLRTERA